MSGEKKRQENVKLGDESYQKAQKFTKKTLTRWKPDWEQAARFYREAVKYYKMGNDESKTITACRESAVAHDELGQFLQTATDLETAAGLMVKESNSAATNNENRSVAYELYREAAINFRKNNSYERSAAMYCKAADLMSEDEKNYPLAIAALDEATDIFIDENRGQFHDSTYKKAIMMAVKFQRYDDAIKYIEKQNKLIQDQSLLESFESDIYKNILCEMILYYHQGDVEGARQVLEKAENNPKFVGSDQFDAASALAEAYDEEESETTRKYRYAIQNDDDLCILAIF